MVRGSGQWRSGKAFDCGEEGPGCDVGEVVLDDGLEIGGDMVRVFGDFLDSVWWSVVLEMVIEDVVVGGV